MDKRKPPFTEDAFMVFCTVVCVLATGGVSLVVIPSDLIERSMPLIVGAGVLMSIVGAYLGLLLYQRIWCSVEEEVHPPSPEQKGQAATNVLQFPGKKSGQ